MFWGFLVCSYEFIAEDEQLQMNILSDLLVLDLQADQTKCLEALNDFTEGRRLHDAVTEDRLEEVVAVVLYFVHEDLLDLLCTQDTEE